MKKRLIIGFFALLLGFSIVSGEQYLYFTGNGTNNNGFQQGCRETLDVNYNLVDYPGDLADKNVSSEVRVKVDTTLVDYTGWIFYTSSIWNNLDDSKYPKYTNGLLEMGLNNNGILQSNSGLLLTIKNIKPHYNSQGSYVVDFVFSNPGKASLGSWIGHGNGFTSSEYTGSITVVQAPCANDNAGPVIAGVNFEQYRNQIKVKRGDLIFDIKDSSGAQYGATNVPYIWKKVGNEVIWTGNNGSDSGSINNQIGVNTGSVYVSVASVLSNGSSHTQVSSGGDVEFHNYSVKSWTGDVYRDFSGKVEASKLFPEEFGIEEKVTITITGADRNGKPSTYTVSFNDPTKPVAILDSSISGNQSVPQSADIKLRVTDDWAGVDSGTIKITLSGTNDEASGGLLIFSGAKLKKVDCISEGTCDIMGSAGGYNVVFNPSEVYSKLPNLATYNVSIEVCDLKGCGSSHKLNSTIGSFTVAAPCRDLQCCGDVDTYVYSGGGYEAKSVRTGELVVSGGNNPTVKYELYETGTEILGFLYTGWIATIDCHVDLPTFTLKKGSSVDPDNAVALTGAESAISISGIYLSGNAETTKATISGNDIIISHYIDELKINFTKPISNYILGGLDSDEYMFVTDNTTISEDGKVHFEWEPKYGENSEFKIASYRFELYLNKNFNYDNFVSDNQGEGETSGDVDPFSISTFDVGDENTGNISLGDDLIFYTGIDVPCIDDGTPCTGADVQLLDGLYVYRVYALDLGSNSGGLAEVNLADIDTISLDNDGFQDTDETPASLVFISGGIVPYADLNKPSGLSAIAGDVEFAWGVQYEALTQYYGGLSGFYWEITKGGEVLSSGYNQINDRSITENLEAGNYKFDIRLIYGDLGPNNRDKTSYDIKVSQKATGGGSFGGGSTQIPKDDCPNGDTSDSYYDGICEGATHGSAVYQCKIDESNYGDERKLAYLYSYINHITTMCPIYDADLDGYLYRDHFAKMISNYAINVLGKKPNLNKTGCDQFEDIADDSAEMKYYMKLACQLNLMGMEPDGQTPKKLFDPYSAVTRAEFGTVFSRLLFGDTYNVKGELKTPDGWYRGHLQALKDYGVMTKIEDPRPSYLELRGRVMIVLMRADHYGLFEGISPALNGIDALFAKKWEANVF